MKKKKILIKANIKSNQEIVKEKLKKEIGKKVHKNFEYNSGTNKHFLKISEIKKTINIDE